MQPILDLPVIPEFITVHLGRPDQPAENNRVSFILFVVRNKFIPLCSQANKQLLLL